jgi:hypothetical protein
VGPLDELYTGRPAATAWFCDRPRRSLVAAARCHPGAISSEKGNPALRQAGSEKRRAGRGLLPDHLPRVEIVIACIAPPQDKQVVSSSSG